MTTTHLCTSHHHNGDGTTYWFTADEITFGLNRIVDADVWVDCDGHPLPVPSEHLSSETRRAALAIVDQLLGS